MQTLLRSFVLLILTVSPTYAVDENLQICSAGGYFAGAQDRFLTGMAMHILNGAVIFPLIYAFVLFAHLPGSPALKGILWGVILWVLAQIVVMPMMGAGVFGLRMGGIMPAFGSLMGHIVYGVLLGWIAGHAHTESHERAATA